VETAIAQIEALGFSWEDVKHIALTHFHYDHAGGLPDFPGAKVHIFQGELDAIQKLGDLNEQ
jgi:glyoxylase-like metal-dependent hydrolase (beta-lactamase superfamily II)